MISHRMTIFYQPVSTAMRLLRSRRLVIINALVALWISVLANYTFLSQFMTFSGASGLKYVGLSISLVTLLWALNNIFIQWLTWSKLAKPMLMLILVISAITAFCVDSFGVGIDMGMIENALQTNSAETQDLISIHSWLYLLIIGIVPCIWLWKFPLQADSTWSRLKDRLLATILSIVVIVISALLFYVNYAAVFREHRDLNYKITPANSISSLIRYSSRNIVIKEKPLLQYGEDAKHPITPTNQQPTLLVLVVGETSRAESFSLNGYARNTNPELSTRGVINFSQTSSCGTATAVSLPCMFSGMTRHTYDAGLAKHREGLLDVIQRAGYEVTWIDNQMGCKKTCTRVQNAPTDKNNPTHCIDGECHDELMVEKLQSYLKDLPVKDRVIVLHAMGSHGPAYYHRYPIAFERFKPACNTNNIQSCTQQQIINTYDNTIVYEDHVLAQVIDTLTAQSANYQTAFWYVSDHGESTGEKGLYLHGAPYMIAPSQQTHVPMIAWLSPAFAQQHANQHKCLLLHKDSASAHDNLFHTMLGLLSVSTKVYDTTLDLATCQS